MKRTQEQLLTMTDTDDLNYTYTIIIPYHNNPLLLGRLLDSIPSREDIEIIVVDDNSDKDKQPQTDRRDVEIVKVSAEESRGAGHARNVGLSLAQGRYIIFADDDDFFAGGFIDVLDRYTGAGHEIVYFGCQCVDSKSLRPTYRGLDIKGAIAKYNIGQKDDLLYKIHNVVGKMYKRDWVIYNGFRFEEIPYGEDMQFSFLTGYFATDILAIEDILYIYTYRQESLTFQKHSLQTLLINIENWYKVKGFFSFLGHENWEISFARLLFRILKNDGWCKFCQVLRIYLGNRKSFTDKRNHYTSIIRSHSRHKTDSP